MSCSLQSQNTLIQWTPCNRSHVHRQDRWHCHECDQKLKAIVEGKGFSVSHRSWSILTGEFVVLTRTSQYAQVSQAYTRCIDYLINEYGGFSIFKYNFRSQSSSTSMAPVIPSLSLLEVQGIGLGLQELIPEALLDLLSTPLRCTSSPCLRKVLLGAPMPMQCDRHTRYFYH